MNIWHPSFPHPSKTSFANYHCKSMPGVSTPSDQIITSKRLILICISMLSTNCISVDKRARANRANHCQINCKTSHKSKQCCFHTKIIHHIVPVTKHPSVYSQIPTRVVYTNATLTGILLYYSSGLTKLSEELLSWCFSCAMTTSLHAIINCTC